MTQFLLHYFKGNSLPGDQQWSKKEIADFSCFYRFTTLLLRHCSSTWRRFWNSMLKLGKDQRSSFVTFFLLGYFFFKIAFTALSCFPGNRLGREASRIIPREQGNVYRLWMVKKNSAKYLTAKTFQVFQSISKKNLSLKVILPTTFSNKKLLTNFLNFKRLPSKFKLSMKFEDKDTFFSYDASLGWGVLLMVAIWKKFYGAVVQDRPGKNDLQKFFSLSF